MLYGCGATQTIRVNIESFDLISRSLEQSVNADAAIKEAGEPTDIQ